MDTTTEVSGVVLEIVKNADQIDADSVNVYQQAFAAPPYEEQFSAEEARAALTDIIDKKGDLLLGRQDGESIALAGGYPKEDGNYYLAELAVRPDMQRRGIGRMMFRALLETIDRRGSPRIELRTAVNNLKAQAIYRSAGFTAAKGTTVVAQKRQNGSIELDERLYMFRPPISEKERSDILKRVVIAYPSGNTTAVVFDQLLDADRQSLNDNTMRSWKKLRPAQAEIEQCCFVTLPRDPKAVARVEMFGGEFCGNATRSAAWLIADGQDYRGLIEVSGSPRPLEFEIKGGEVAVEMPLPDQSTLIRQVNEGVLVQLDGIAQLVVTDTGQRSAESARQLLDRLISNDAYGLAKQPAVGVTYYDETSAKAKFCVWVKEVNTIFDETACGSGTSAIGIASAVQAGKSQKMSVVQPSGDSISTEAVYRDGAITKSRISGRVNILYDGELPL